MSKPECPGTAICCISSGDRAGTCEADACTAGRVELGGVCSHDVECPSGQFCGHGQCQLLESCGAVVNVGAVFTCGASSVALGGDHACAIVNGGAQCWGNNVFSMLGNNSMVGSNVPVQAMGLASGASAITAGFSQSFQSCAVANGGAECWGMRFDVVDRLDANPVPTPVPGLATGVTAIAAGGGHDCVLIDGAVWCWGSNEDGQLGNDSTINSAAPVQAQGLTAGVTAISAGSKHTCAIVNGAAQCWGSNTLGALGSDAGSLSSVPVQVTGLTSGVTAISAGWHHTCAVVDGGVVCWGGDIFGSLGDGQPQVPSVGPVQVQGLTSGATAVAAGSYHSCAVVNGGVQCWGRNLFGELGNNSLDDVAVPVPVQCIASGATGVAAGDYFTCAVVSGHVLCWGANGAGQLGNASTTDAVVPVEAQLLGFNGAVCPTAAAGQD